MAGPWREQSNERSIRPVVAPVARARAQDPPIASEAVTAAVVGLVVALLTWRCLPARTAPGTPLALACGHEGAVRETAARIERWTRPMTRTLLAVLALGMLVSSSPPSASPRVGL
jgi:hypothetical protein